MDTRGIQGSPPPPIRVSPGSLYVSSPESSPPPSPERSPGVGLSSRGPNDLVNMPTPLASVRYPLVPHRVGRANRGISALRPSWLGPNNTGEDDEVAYLLDQPDILSAQQEEDAREAAMAQGNQNTRSAIDAAIRAKYIPPESVSRGVFKSLRPESATRAMGGRRRKKTLKRRKTKNNRRRRASKTR
jgi:hypothetical protein